MHYCSLSYMYVENGGVCVWRCVYTCIERKVSLNGCYTTFYIKDFINRK